MPRPRRFLTVAGLWIQGGAVFALWAGLFRWPPILPNTIIHNAGFWLVYLLGYCFINAMLTAEFLRKTQLEGDQIAAQEIQRTLQPETLDELPGYQIETFSKPFRDVGGDYFDVIQLPDSRMLFAVADVSGKGMPAALLSANIQALVRSIAYVERDPRALAGQINRHLCRYTPSDRFATALFIVLTPETGHMAYVNAGHNAPIVYFSGSATYLEATGPPLGMFTDAEHEVRHAAVHPGARVLLFTDGLTDSVPGAAPEQQLRDALADESGNVMSRVIALIEPTLNQDDVTMLLVQRRAN